MTKTLNIREVVKMCQNGKAKEARGMLMGLLSATPPEAKAEQKRLLDGMFSVEIYEGNAKAALKILKRRRELGYRNLEQRMDAVLEACTLLYREDRFVEAQSELMGLLLDKHSLDWYGLLSALSLYVAVDEKCRKLMASVLVEASGVAIRKFGIPIPVESTTAEAPQTIKTAHSMFRTDSKLYSELLYRAFNADTRDARERIIADLREFSEGKERVDFFKDQARQLLAKLELKVEI